MWNSLRPSHLQHLQTSPDRQGWHADSTHTAFSHLFFNILLIQLITFMYIRIYVAGGLKNSSPSLEINFDSTNLTRLYPAHSARGGVHSTKEVETSEPTQSLSSLPLPPSQRSYMLLTWLVPKGSTVSRITPRLRRS